MRSTKMIVFALLNETGRCFLDPGLGLLVEHPLDQLPKRVGWEPASARWELAYRERRRPSCRTVLPQSRRLHAKPSAATSAQFSGTTPHRPSRSTRRSRTYGARYEPVAEDVAVSTRFRS